MKTQKQSLLWLWIVVAITAIIVLLVFFQPSYGQEKKGGPVKQDTTVSRLVYIAQLESRIRELQTQEVILQNIVAEYRSMTADSITFRKPDGR